MSGRRRRCAKPQAELLSSGSGAGNRGRRLRGRACSGARSISSGEGRPSAASCGREEAVGGWRREEGRRHGSGAARGKLGFGRVGETDEG